MCRERKTYKSLLQTTKRPCPKWIHGQSCLVLDFGQDLTQLTIFIKEARICKAFILTTLVIPLINVAYQNTLSKPKVQTTHLVLPTTRHLVLGQMQVVNSRSRIGYDIILEFGQDLHEPKS
jgi:hypothetical protein